MNFAKIVAFGLACVGVSAQYSDTLYAGTTTTVNIQETPSPTNSIMSRTVTFTAAETCLNPTATFIYEEIDYSWKQTEFLDWTYNGRKFANCSSTQRNCGQYDTCINDSSLARVGLTSIAAGSSVTFNLDIGGEVDSLCTSDAGAGLAVNAYFSITCNGALNLIPCSATNDYVGVVTPGATETVYIQETPSPTNSIQTVSICVGVPAGSGDCENPTVTFVYEQIDYSWKSTEYLDLSYSGSQFSNCYSTQYDCFNFSTCLNDYDLSAVGLNSIPDGGSAEFSLEIGGEVDSLCTSAGGAGLAVNAEFSVTCSGATLSCTGPQSHEIDTSGVYVDASQCGLGCSSATSAADCNHQCLMNAQCSAYVYAPGAANECALFSSTSPVARAATQIMCTPCAGSYAKAENPVQDVMKIVQPAVVTGKKDDNMMWEFLALNAAVSAGVSLVVLSVLFVACYCCGCVSCKRNAYSRVQKDVEMDY